MNLAHQFVGLGAQQRPETLLEVASAAEEPHCDVFVSSQVVGDASSPARAFSGMTLTKL